MSRHPFRRQTLTVGVIAKNEQKLLGRCLQSIRTIADEIILVDTGSTDKTVAIAKEFGARIFHHRWTQNYSAARNVYLKHATGDWVLSLDADETISARDLPSLRKLIEKKKVAGYFLKRRVYASDRGWFLSWRPVIGEYPSEERLSKAAGSSQGRILRLFRKKKGVFFQKAVHESAERSIREAGGIIADCSVTIHDFGYLKGKAFHARKHQRYNRMLLSADRRTDGHQLLNVAIVHAFFKRNFPAAVRCLERALKTDPDHALYLYLLAIVRREQKMQPRAIALLRKALRTDPKYPDALWLLGLCLDETGGPKRALGPVRKALKAVPGHPIYLNSLGVIYFNLGNRKMAEKVFRQVRGMLPLYRQPRNNLLALRGKD